MTFADFPHNRLVNQRLARPLTTSPAGVVSELGGIQGQDYAGAKWTIGVRLAGATDDSVERAFKERSIVRTWAMRGTLHVIAAEDLRWMLTLVAPKVIRSSARRHRQLELDGSTFARSYTVLSHALRDGAQLTRDELRTALERAGISPAGQRLSHILARAALEQLICFGSRRGKQHTFALLDDWIEPRRSLGREQALKSLALRYFSSRGPASVDDYLWWSGLPAADARAGLEAAESELIRQTVGGVSYWMKPPIAAAARDAAHLLQGFDEYILAYRDRSAVLPDRHAPTVTGLNGMFGWTIVFRGHVIGTWKRTLRKNAAVITPKFFQPLSSAATEAVTAAADRYGRFLGVPARIVEQTTYDD